MRVDHPAECPCCTVSVHFDDHQPLTLVMCSYMFATYAMIGEGTPSPLSDLWSVTCETQSKTLVTSRNAMQTGRLLRYAPRMMLSSRKILSAHPSTGTNAFCLGLIKAAPVSRKARTL